MSGFNNVFLEVIPLPFVAVPSPTDVLNLAVHVYKYRGRSLLFMSFSIYREMVG